MQVQVAVERDEAEKENGGGLDFLESGLQGLSLNLNPAASAAVHAQQGAAELAKTPVVTRTTRSKAAPKKPVKRVMLRDK